TKCREMCMSGSVTMTDETAKPEGVPGEPLKQPVKRPLKQPLKRPLKLKPRFVPRLWGGDALPAFHGASSPELLPREGHTPIGESWLLGDDNEIAGGPLNGRVVKDLA